MFEYHPIIATIVYGVFYVGLIVAIVGKVGGRDHA